MKRRWRRIVLIVGLVGWAAWLWLPFPQAKLERYPFGVTIVDRDSQPMRVMLNEADALCLPVRLADTGPWLGPAIVAAEDKRFFHHRGVDVLALGRAIRQNLTSRRVVSGASTLSTQVIRLVEPRPRDLWAKLVEMLQALRMERRYTKSQILEQYLNRAPFGSNLIGVEAASRRYFGKSAADLSLAEAAVIAGLPQAPTRLRPDRYPERAARRRSYVLHRMLEEGFITSEQCAAADSEPIACRSGATVFRAPHFCDLVRAHRPQSPIMHTTLDSALQLIAEEALQQRTVDLSREGIHGGAVVIMDVRSGAVRALVGSPNFWDQRWQGQVNGADSPRSPGSALKPFIYAMAIDQGLCTPASIVADVPMVTAQFQPENYDHVFSGPVSVREALVRSLNIPALRITQQIGPENVLQLLRRVGLTTLDKTSEHYGLGLALGSGEVTLLDLANAYACLARLGSYRRLRLLEAESPSPPVRIFSPEAAWLVADILSGDERAADASGHIADVQLPRVAWKTGTSAGLRDAWTVAYNPDYVVGVWLGNPAGQNSPALVGRQVAAPLAYEIFRRLYPAGHAPWFSRPSGIETRVVCARSGMPARECCESTVTDWSIRGVSPVTECTIHQRLPDRQVFEVWPEEIAAFLSSHGMASLATNHNSMASPLRILTPVTGVVLSRPQGNVLSNQRIPLRAEAGGIDKNLYWFVDGKLHTIASAASPVFWFLTLGQHTISCSDPDGHSDAVSVMVR
jgi:penicillin-binding protein 1C